jgi:hypothetical protein
VNILMVEIKRAHVERFCFFSYVCGKVTKRVGVVLSVLGCIPVYLKIFVVC